MKRSPLGFVAAANSIIYGIIGFVAWDLLWLFNAGDWETKARTLLVGCILCVNFMCALIISKS